MDAYFTLNSWISLAKSINDENSHLINFLKRGTQLKFLFSKKEIDNLIESNPKQKNVKKIIKIPKSKRLDKITLNRLNSLIISMCSNRGNDSKEKYDQSLPSCIMNRTYENGEFNDLTAIYCLNNTTSHHAIKHDNSVLCSTEGEEINTIKKLFIENDDIPTRIYRTKNMGKDWDIIRKNTIPLTDIIITDRYLTKIDIEKWETNFLKILEILLENGSQKIINIVVITQLSPSLDPMLLKLMIEKMCKNVLSEEVTVNITLIYSKVYPKDKNCKVSIDLPKDHSGNDSTNETRSNFRHERQIITNYKTFISGDSFTYYRKKGGEFHTKDENFIVSSYMLSDYFDNIKDYLSELGEEITNLKICGARKSNLLSIPQEKIEKIELPK